MFEPIKPGLPAIFAIFYTGHSIKTRINETSQHFYLHPKNKILMTVSYIQSANAENATFGNRTKKQVDRRFSTEVIAILIIIIVVVNKEMEKLNTLL